MSQSIKFILISLVLLAPKLSEAKTLNFDKTSWEIDPKPTIISQNTFIRNFDIKNLSQHILLDKQIENQVIVLDSETILKIQAIEKGVNQPVANAQLEIMDGWAKSFTPHQDGQSLDVYELIKLLAQTSDRIDIPVLKAKPQTTLSDLNSLGIKELVAIGESDFTGSSKNRITNITVGASRFNGLILEPGEEFSFNQYLGPVDAEHGFKPEIVIKREGLLPEYGGGLCQVSSTAFRAAMNGGMKITARRNHSFAVRYYTPAGSDATIYDPVQDFKFVNDYPGHLLVRTRMEGNKLFYEYYSTKDTRVVELDGPHQYDHKPDGSLKAVWTKRVTKNGTTDEQIFRSIYVSPNLYQKVAVTESKPSIPPATPAPSPTPEPVPTPTPPST